MIITDLETRLHCIDDSIESMRSRLDRFYNRLSEMEDKLAAHEEKMKWFFLGISLGEKGKDENHSGDRK